MSPLPIRLDYPLILASASPRRKRLLEQVGIPFRAVASRCSEDRIRGSADSVTQVLAKKKALEVLQREHGNWILGADTTVTIGTRMLGKPKNDEEAMGMLRLLSDKEHRVITAFCVVDPTGRVAHLEAVSTTVRFKQLSDREITGYVETKEPIGKAGSYAIQGIGAFMVERISGSYTNVVGLPLCAVIQGLLTAGALDRFPGPPQVKTAPEGDGDQP
jgi:septum formation protein